MLSLHAALSSFRISGEVVFAGTRFCLLQYVVVMIVEGYWIIDQDAAQVLVVSPSPRSRQLQSRFSSVLLLPGYSRYCKHPRLMLALMLMFIAQVQHDMYAESPRHKCFVAYTCLQH